MSKLHYTPASDGWLAVAGDRQLLLVEPGVADAAELWSAAAQGFQASLDVLTRGGFATMPSFALLERSAGDDSLRVIVRGPVSVSVVTGGGVRTLDGTGVSTWTEQLISGATGAAIDVVASAEAPSLPLVSGVAFAARAAWGAPPAEPAPAAEPVEAQPQPAEPVEAQPPVAEPVEVQPPVAEPVEAPNPEITIVDFPVAAAAAPSADVAGDDSGYDYLFGETMYRNVSDAVVPEAADDDDAASSPEPLASGEPGTGADSEPAGDHDGMTLMSGDIRKLRAQRRAAAQASRVQERAPELFLELSTGGRESLSQPVLVGRAPTASKVSGGALPRLVTIPGDKDISRNHVQITVEGGTVVVTDLHSRNGTQIVLPGKSPQQLRQGEPTSVIVGTVVDLGGGVTLTVREGD